MRVLFVCSGNICRSPTAEAVFAHQAERRGIAVHADGVKNSVAIEVSGGSLRLKDSQVSTGNSLFATTGISVSNIDDETVEIIRNKIVAGDITDTGMMTGWPSLNRSATSWA